MDSHVYYRKVAEFFLLSFVSISTAPVNHPRFDGVKQVTRIIWMFDVVRDAFVIVSKKSSCLNSIFIYNRGHKSCSAEIFTSNKTNAFAVFKRRTIQTNWTHRFGQQL